jgi:hypothetical protein
MRAGFDSETLKFPEQSVPVQTKDPGCLSLIPLDLLEDVEDVLLLKVAPGLTQAQPDLLDVLNHVSAQDGDVEG